ncbi:MAG TPA: hypothetical protein DCQ92_05720 [Verrucomicrobia subdivision 3 bacterium]|nr:hypothetical protein [Limisphaerales bacterium]
MPYLPVVIIIAFVVFYHRAAEFENESTLLWSGLSVLISATTFSIFVGEFWELCLARSACFWESHSFGCGEAGDL